MSFQPICGLCLSDCDRRGSVTSCSHFLCSRCLARLPTAAPCPVCRRPCQMVCLDQPAVQHLLQSGSAALAQGSRVVSTQLRHYEQINRRMRQALGMLHGQLQTLQRQREEEAARHATDSQKIRTLEGECHRLREQLARAPLKLPPPPQALSPTQIRRSRSSSSVASSSASRAHRHDGQADSGRHYPSHHQQPSHHRHGYGGVPHFSPSPAPVAGAAAGEEGAPRSIHQPHRGNIYGQAMRSVPSTPRQAPPPSSAAAEGRAPLAPLGWSSSSLFAKRRQAGTGDVAAADSVASPHHNQRHHHQHTATPAAASNSQQMVTPRSQAIASPRPPQLMFGLRSGAWSEERAVQPSRDFRLDTPLAAVLQEQRLLSDPSPSPSTPSLHGMVQSLSMPLQKLFAMRGSVP